MHFPGDSLRGDRRRAWLFFFLLVALATAWRLPYAATKPIVQVDEVRFTWPTVERFLSGDPVLYIAGTNYGAPLEQAAAAGLCALLGESAVAFRLPTVLLGSLAIGVFFLALRRTAGTRAAFFLAVPLALAPSAFARYTTFSHGAYATLLLATACIQLATLRVEERRSLARWLVLGVAFGAGLYALKLAIFQVGASLAWLGLRSGYFERLRAHLRVAPRRVRMMRAGIFTAALGLLALGPVLYHWLTRRETFAISPLEKWIVVAAAMLCAAGAALLLPALCAPRPRECVAVAGALALLAAIPLPAAIWFRKVELPRLTARGDAPYAEASYSLKHLHAWPNQARLLLEGVLPALLLGRWDEVRSYEERETLGWKSAIAAAGIAALAAAGLARWRRGKNARRARDGKFPPPDPARPTTDAALPQASLVEREVRAFPFPADLLFIAPFFLTLAVIFPSWLLHSESSFRYLLPFVPGIWLLAYRCGEDHIAAHPRVAAALLALYAGYGAFDCFHHIA